MRHWDPTNPKVEAIRAVLSKTPVMSYQEIADATGQSRTNVVHHVRMLAAAGLIVWKGKGKGRKSKAEAGRQGRGVNAFVPRMKSKKETGIEQRIEEIVRRAREQEMRDPGYDVVNHNPRRLRLGKAVRIG